MTNSSSKRGTEIAQATQLIAGFQKHLAGVASITLASTVYTPAQITAALQLLVALHTAVVTARSTVAAKLTAEKAQAPTLRNLMVALESYVKVTYSESPDVLADFGLTPKKVATKLTTEEQVVAVAKRASTRVSRGTTSKKAKEEIKGNVVDVVLTPIKAGLPVATSAAPGTPAIGGTTGGTTPHGT